MHFKRMSSNYHLEYEGTLYILNLPFCLISNAVNKQCTFCTNV